MNNDEILQMIDSSNFPVGMGGYDSDEFDTECEIYNITIFDGTNSSNEIIQNKSKIFKIHHENLSEIYPENLINFLNLQIIRDDEWELKMFLSQIEAKKYSLFSRCAKNALVDSQFALSKAKNSIEYNDPFASCWIKSATISLIDSVLLQNQILPTPSKSLSSMRNLKEKNTNQFVDKIISETGIERATISLLTRMLKSSIGFLDMIEQNKISITIEKKANYLIQNSLLSDCYLYLLYQNRNNFYKIKDSLNKNSDKIHVLKTAFDLSNDLSASSQSIDSLSKITNSLLHNVL